MTAPTATPHPTPSGSLALAQPDCPAEQLELMTTRFGSIIVDPASTFTLPDGIPGFRDLTGLVMISVDRDALFVWLQAVSDGALAFLAVNPWPYFPDYDVEIADEHLAALGVSDVSQIVVYCLARPDRDHRAFHVNLLAPLVLGLEHRRGRQITLDEHHDVQALLALPESPVLARPRVRVPAPLANELVPVPVPERSS